MTTVRGPAFRVVPDIRRMEQAIGDDPTVPPVPATVTLTGIVNWVELRTVTVQTPLMLGVLPTCPAIVTFCPVLRRCDAVQVTTVGFATLEFWITEVVSPMSRKEQSVRRTPAPVWPGPVLESSIVLTPLTTPTFASWQRRKQMCPLASLAA